MDTWVRGQEMISMGVPAQALPRNLPNPSPSALAKTGLRTGSGSPGLSIPYSVRSTRYVRTLYVTLEYPCTAGRWGYLLGVLNILPYGLQRVQIMLHIGYCFPETKCG